MDSAQATAPAPVETRTIHKLRIRIIPFLFLLYIVAYLDRINIGFAALTMNREIGITSQQFGLLVGVFFLGYFLFEIPSNLLLHKIGARIWIARILISWGIVAALTGFVQGASQLYVARFVLGVMEAGFFSRHHLVPDLLVPAAGTGSNYCSLHGGVAHHQYFGGHRFPGSFWITCTGLE
jgi:sugar phosphate permease